MKKIKRIIVSLVMLLCFLAANGGSEGLVLCLGENGHVSLEGPHGEFCSKFSPSTDDFNFKNHKNHCVDLALSTGGLYQDIVPSKSIEPLIAAPVVAVASNWFTPQPDGAGPDFFLLSIPKINTSVEYLRSVVLLI